MARYAQLHPGLIDQESHLHTLSQSTPSQSTPTGSQVNPGKHERAEDVSFEYSETKKPKYVLLIIYGSLNTKCSCSIITCSVNIILYSTVYMSM